MDWKLLLFILMFGAPAWAAGLFYLALRVVPPRLMWLRSVLVVLAVLFIGEFVFLVATYHPR